MSTNNENLRNFLEKFGSHFENMEQSVKNNEWHFIYDDVSDILYFVHRNKKFSDDSILIPAGETCISARISKNGEIEGIVVEDFGSLFVPGNPEFKKFYDKIKQSSSSQIEPITLRRAYALLLSDFNSAVQQNPLTV